MSAPGSFLAHHETGVSPLRSESHSRAVLTALALAAGSLFCGQVTAAGDAVAGKTVFANQCSSCHTTEAGKNGFGPSLAGVLGRKAGGLAGFSYSPAMAHSGLSWDEKTLDEFLTSSTQKVPGTSMSVMLTNASDRANVIAYLETLGRASAAATSTPAAGAPSPGAPSTQGPTQEELLRAAQDTQNWLYASKDYTGQRFVDLRQITAKNAGQLRAACIYRSNNAGATQTNPLVYKGVMYLTIDKAIVAIDATTCRERWTYNWEAKGAVLSPANRGVALKDGRVVRGTADGYLIAVDMGKGTLLWSQKIADAKTSQYLSMPPLIHEDLVIYGPAGADWGAKNWIGAFKLSTGEQVWRFNLIPEAGEPGAETWKDPASREHGGGSLWTPLSLDARKGVLYVPVGNPAPDFYPDARPGTNLYTNSAVALDVRTGKLLWYRQFGPSDANDRDLSQVSPIFSATVKGKPRDLLTVSGKDGLAAHAGPRQPRRALRGGHHDTHQFRGGTDRRRRSRLPWTARRHGVERPGVQPGDQDTLRCDRGLVRHVHEVRQGPPVRRERSLLRRRGNAGPARAGEGMAAGDRRHDWRHALAPAMADAAGRRHNGHLGRRAFHRRSQQRLSRHRRQQWQDALPLQYRRLDRRRRNQLRDRRQAVRRHDFRCGLRILRWERHLGDHRLFPSLGPSRALAGAR